MIGISGTMATKGTVVDCQSFPGCKGGVTHESTGEYGKIMTRIFGKIHSKFTPVFGEADVLAVGSVIATCRFVSRRFVS